MYVELSKYLTKVSLTVITMEWELQLESIRIIVVHHQYSPNSVFNALSIGSGLVALVLLCMKRDVIF